MLKNATLTKEVCENRYRKGVDKLACGAMAVAHGSCKQVACKKACPEAKVAAIFVDKMQYGHL